MDIKHKAVRVISHRIPSSYVKNVDYSVDENELQVLTVLTENSTVHVQFSPQNFIDFRTDIADMNNYLDMPDNTYSASKVTALNDDQSFYITDGDLIGKVIVSLESSNNAPYLLIRTEPLKGYSRTIQIYLTPAQVDKLDIDTIRDVPVVYSYQSVITVDGVDPNIILTCLSSSFIDIGVPSPLLAGLQTEMQAEVDFLNDPLIIDNIVYKQVVEKNAKSFTIDPDEIISISTGHMSVGYTPFLQLVVDQPAKLRRLVMTIYMRKEILEDLNTIIQGW
jgi:hypothetical protein